MVKEKQKRKKRYCFRRTNEGTVITIPKEIADDLEIKDGEKTEIKKDFFQRGEKIIIKISRGESTFD